MVIRNILIRFLASCIYFWHRKKLQSTPIRFVVFTGTSGKTLSRSATTFALRKVGFQVISSPFGYTNELGIVLAALNIESIQLLSILGLKKIFTARPVSNAFVCIELGADFRNDIAWFLKHFKPLYLCITDTATEEWGLPLNKIWNDKKKLIDNIPVAGKIVWSVTNPSQDRLKSLFKSDSRSCAIHPLTTTSTFSVHFELFSPHRQALAFAKTFLEILGKGHLLHSDFFNTYIPPQDRLRLVSLPNEKKLLCDVYKAIPYCTEYVLSLALSMQASERIVVLSALHPQVNDAHYIKLIPVLQKFEYIYFIGPKNIYKLIHKNISTAVYIKNQAEYHMVAKDIMHKSKPSSLITIKGAGRYHFDSLIQEITSI